MTEEKKRSILVSADEVECNMTIKVPGETITMLARQFWRQGSHLRAIQFLMEGVKNIPWHIAIGVLEGRLKFVGDPKITVETDDTKDLPTYEQTLKMSENLRDRMSGVEHQLPPHYNPKNHVETVRREPEAKSPKQMSPNKMADFTNHLTDEMTKEADMDMEIDEHNFMQP